MGTNQFLVLDRGIIVQSGNHDHLMQQDGIYRNSVEQRQRASSWLVTQA